MMRSNKLIVFLVFVVASLTKYDITLLARVPLSELVAFGSIPFLLNGLNWASVRGRLRVVFTILGVWLLAVLISDVFNGFEFGRFIRGVMKPIFCGFWMLFFVGVIMRNFKALFAYPLGTVVAALQNYIAPQAWTADRVVAGGYEAVAYGVVPIITAICLSVAVILYTRSRWWAVGAFLLTAAALVIAESPRSNIAVMVLNALIIVYIWWTHRDRRVRQAFTMRKFVVLGCLGFVALLGIYYLYVALAGNGLMGEMQQRKLLTQSQTTFGNSPLGLVLGGRTAMFGAILAVFDSPIIGHGSWTGWTLANFYFEAIAYVGTDPRQLDAFVAAGVAPSPGHSILFTSWMESGFLAAVALVAIGVIVLRQILLIVNFDSRFTPVFISIGTSFMWHFLFSPFGTFARFAIGLFCALYVTKFCVRRLA